LVNIWGVPPFFDPFWRGNLLGLKELVSLLGYEANIFFGPEAKLSLIKKAAGAKLNILVSGLYGLEAAELFKEIHGVNYVKAPLPFGTAASERFLEITGKALKVPKGRVKKAIESARARRYGYLEAIVDVYNDMEAQRHVLIVGDANYALSLSDFFAEDLGWIPELAVVTNSLNIDDKEKLLSFHKETGGPGPERLVFENRSAEIAKAARVVWAGNGKKYHDSLTPIFVAGSSLERSLAQDIGATHLSLTYPISNRAVLTKGFTGHFGGLELTEDLISACIAGR
jgi:nitrogenase molybdenum-iron protein beta chain